MIFVSTSCLKGTRRLDEILEIYAGHGIKNIELGSGLEYVEDVGGLLGRYHDDMNFIVHNYFPPAEEPFIMNLASQDETIRRSSLIICKNAIELCHTFGYGLYSFHPGFRVNRSLELSFDMTSASVVSYHAAFENFSRSIEEIIAYAKKRKIDIAIENLEHKNEAYMMTGPEEFEIFLDIFPDVGVLLDLGHLKIASKKLNFSMDEFIKTVDENIFGVHIHENDGVSDLHLEPKNSEILKYLDYVDCGRVILESRDLDIEQIICNFEVLEAYWG